MNLVIDIGNTRTKFSVFNRGEVLITVPLEEMLPGHIEMLQNEHPDLKSVMVSGSDEEDLDLSEHDETDVVTLEGVFALVFQSQISFAKMIQRWIIEGFVEKVFLIEDESKELELLPAEVVC